MLYHIVAVNAPQGVTPANQLHRDRFLSYQIRAVPPFEPLLLRPTDMELKGVQNCHPSGVRHRKTIPSVVTLNSLAVFVHSNQLPTKLLNNETLKWRRVTTMAIELDAWQM